MSNSNSSKNRRAVNIQDRLIDCACCHYPISEQHHLLSFAEWGEDLTIPLCANCHELMHLIQHFMADSAKYSKTDAGRKELLRQSRAAKLLTKVKAWDKIGNRLEYLGHITDMVFRYETALKNQKKIEEMTPVDKVFLLCITDDVDKYFDSHTQELLDARKALLEMRRNG